MEFREPTGRIPPRAIWRSPKVWGMPAAFAALFILLGALTGSLVSGPPPELLRSIGLGFNTPYYQPWTLLSSSFFAVNLAYYLVTAALFFLGLCLATRFAGIWRTLLAFLLSALLSSFLLSALLEWGLDNGNQWLSYLGGNLEVGGFGGLCGALGMATSAMDSLWRRRVRSWLLAVTIMFVLYLGTAQTIMALVGALAGIGLGAILLRRSADHQLRHSSLRETRVLVSTVVAVFAIGPLLSQLSAGFAVGPLSLANQLMLQSIPDKEALSNICGGDPACITLQDTVGISSPGAVLLTLVPVLLLLACADGLRRGRRLSWWITLSVQIYVLAFTGFIVAVFYGSSLTDFSGEDSDVLFAYLVPTMLAPALTILVLWSTKAAFGVRTSPTGRRALARTGFGLAGSLIVVYTLAWFAEDNLANSDIEDLLTQLPHLLIPFPSPFELFPPQGLVSAILYNFGATAIWAVILYLLVRDYRRFGGLGKDQAVDAQQAEALIRRGGGALSHMAMWEGNHFWFTPDGRAGVAYQVHHGVALTVAEPFGDPRWIGEAARGFVSHCIELGLVPCFYSAPAELGTALADLGFYPLEVAEETRLDVTAQTFKGKEWQNVRTALNKARKLEITDRWGSFASFPPTIRAQIAQLSEAWVAEKALPQLGFTLGGLDELKDESVVCCLAVDEAGSVLAVTSWLPVYADGEVVSWTLDFMRRHPDSFNGVMEFMIACAVKRFQGSVQEISLSGSPLAGVADTNAGEQPQDGMERLLSSLAAALEPFYGFRSLAAFKSRFQPSYRTLYMYYQDSLALPSIALAVSEAYLPGLSARQRTQMLRQLISG